MDSEITKGKKSKGKGGRKPKERILYHVHFNEPPTGAHAAAQGHVEALRAGRDAGKSAAAMAATGNPVENPHQDRRVSEPLTQGHANSSTGDHGLGQGRNGAVAYGHPDLRQQGNLDFSEVLSRLHTVRGNVLDLGIPDNSAGGFSHAGEVALRIFDAAAQAGSYSGMPDIDPDPLRPAAYPARTSATADNGSHSYDSQQAACSRSPVSAKTTASDRLAVMRATQRVIT